MAQKLGIQPDTEQIEQLKSILRNHSDASIRFAVFCLLSDLDRIEVEMDDSFWSSTIPKITNHSLKDLEWMFGESEMLQPEWSVLFLKHKHPMITNVLRCLANSIHLNSERRHQLFAAIQYIVIDTKDTELVKLQAYAMQIFSSLWEFYEPANIESKIVPMLLSALKTNNADLKDSCARALINFDATPERVLPVLKEAASTHPNPDYLQEVIQYFKDSGL